jgi:hypothetical protein
MAIDLRAKAQSTTSWRHGSCTFAIQLKYITQYITQYTSIHVCLLINLAKEKENNKNAGIH